MILRQKHIPSAPLDQFVDVIWMEESSNTHIRSSHHAPLFTELIFNFGGSFQIEGQNVEYFNDEGVVQIISGLKTKPFQTIVSGAYSCVGLILKPFCFGILLDHLGKRTLHELSEIIYETIVDSETPNFNDLEKSLSNTFSKYEWNSDLIKFEDYISSIDFQKGIMRDFNSCISISQKSFIGKFKKLYHITPNEYFQLKKIGQSIALIEQNKSLNLTKISLKSGFYDQSHFIRLFNKFCGYSPKKHLHHVY